MKPVDSKSVGTKTQCSGTETSPGHQTPKEATTTKAVERTKEDATAYFLSITLGHLCIKAAWLSVLQVMAQFEPTQAAVVWFSVLCLILTATDMTIQEYFLLATDGVDPGARRFRVGCGMSLTLAYLLLCSPFATSAFACLWFLVWANLAFNAGCVVEMGFGLFRGAVDVLDDGDWADWELPREMEAPVVCGIVAGLTCFLCVWCFLEL
ncbi:hypothetical protein VSDG_02224 [Cytospora chrysosperma]|uniref:Uncharacterized protein n=1 Tax=Cytospora chrysosperma TaxID=252740 RepID=A0A423WEA4_CYTCH|nr:hypothetical protein VSDG_02224 [Valsa sordida]